MIGLLLLTSVTAAVIAEEVCYEGLDCFTDDPPFADTLERPMKYLPWPPERIDTRFLLLTRENPNCYEVVNSTNVSTSSFNTSRKTCIIIHGYLDDGYESWIMDLCKTLLNVSDLNCFSVDWGCGAHAMYMQAANNIRVVGAEVANFLTKLIDSLGYHLSNVYLIGHSLGAHAAGEAGKRLPGISRISGMDPAGLYFRDTPPEVRLDPTDADFVDAIHTDGSGFYSHLGLGGYGMLEPSGHLDFYPNGGEHMPGCSKMHIKHYDLGGIFTGIENKVTCNHGRSHQFFTQSIVRPHGFISYRGSSYMTFQYGAGFPCSNGSCAMMGYYADLYVRDSNTSQKFYLNTGYPKNFSRWRYRVSVTIAGTTFAMGSFTISLCGSNGCSCQHKIHSGLIHSGISYTAFIDVEKDIYPVKKVTFVWHKHMVFFFHPTLTASFVSIQYGPNGRIYTFCGKNPTKEDIRQTLKAC